MKEERFTQWGSSGKDRENYSRVRSALDPTSESKRNERTRCTTQDKRNSSRR